VDIRRQTIRFVEGTDPHEANGIAAATVIAPDGDATPRTAGDYLTFAAVGWRVDAFHLSREQLDAIGLDERVQRERRACFALAPSAMTAMNEQGFRSHAVPQVPASAAALVR
jgi:hypothetical protein